MRKAVLVTAILMVILFAESMAQIAFVKANPFTSLSLGIKSPENRSYNTTTISVIFNVNAPIQSSKIVKMSYSLDGASNRTLSISSSESSRFGTPMVFYVGTGTLRNLGNGTHSLEVYALDAKGQTMTYPTGRTFIVNATSSSNSEQPFAASTIIFALVIAIIIVAIGSVVAVVIYRRKNRLANKQNFL